MKKECFKVLSFLVLILLSGCSSKDDPQVEETDTNTNTTENVGFNKTNVKNYMVDQNATAETIALFYNLKMLAETKFLVGQHNALSAVYNNGSTATSDIKKTTGYDPAFVGSDFLFITDKSNNGLSNNWFYQQEVKITADIKKAYDYGAVNMFTWHIKDPYTDTTFKASDLTEEQKNNAFKSILPGGANHGWYKLKLDKVASVISNLKGSDGKLIPVIFRPFHEYDGNWFWWGAPYCTAEEFKTGFQFTVDYLKNVKGLHNVLYAFSPDRTNTTAAAYLSRYPGDAYVDILGMDNYGDLKNLGQPGAVAANSKLKILSDLAETKVKIAALTETGYAVSSTVPPITGWFSDLLYYALSANDVKISFVMFWNNSATAYYVPTPEVSNAPDFISFANKPKAVLANTMPNMYVIP